MPHPLAHFYQGKRVLVTGHTGFEGGWLVAWLKMLGAQVSAYGPPPAARPNFFDATLLDRGITSIFGDLRDRDTLGNTLADCQPEIVVHLAAQASTRSAKLEAAEIFSQNVLGTVHVLEEARLTGSVRTLVVLGSDCCYEPRNWLGGAREEDALGGEDPFSASMACCDLVSSAFGSLVQNAKIGLARVRMSDAIGGGDWEENRPVPNLVRALTSEQPATVKGSKLAVWHVLDAVRGCLMLAKNLFESGRRYSGAWNIAPGEDGLISDCEVARDFIRLWGGEQPEPVAMNPVAGDRGALRLNTQRARLELGWTPVLAPRQALEWTVAWYRSFYGDPSSGWRTTEDQLDEYTRMTATQARATS